MRKFIVWLKTITFYEILVGMKATMSHLLHYKPITLQYPHEKRILPDNYRGMLALLPLVDALPNKPAAQDMRAFMELLWGREF